MTLAVESAAVRHNTQTFNRNRYVATGVLPDYDALKDRARAIKEKSIAQLPQLIETLSAAVKRNGGHFYFAADAADACRYVAGACQAAGARPHTVITRDFDELRLALEVGRPRP